MSTVYSPSKVGSTAAPSTDPGSRSRLRWAVPAAALVAVATRGALAWQLDAVCRDAHFYEMLADRMRAGDLDGAFHGVELNLYVAVLALLRAAGEATGFGATNAALAWGVLVAGLTVFPLFDWWKRQFGFGVALGGIATFAVHPAFTETGVEPIRDGTFWLLVACTFAACHRAAEPQLDPPADGGPTPPRWRWFLLAGLAATAATLTRTEGWLLFAALLGWTAVAAWRRPADRPRLLGGATAAVATVPATLLAVNLTLLHGHSQWEWGRLAVLHHMFRWTRRKLTGTLAEGSAADPAAHADAVAQSPVFQDAAVAATDPHALTSAAEAGDPLWLVYAEGLLGAYKPVFLLLCGIGLLWHWRRMLRPDALPCWCVSLGVMVAVFQRLAQHGEINGRYFLLPALLSLPVVGLLLNDAVRWARASLPSRNRAGAVRSPVRRWWRTAVVGTPMLALATLHVVDGQQADHPGRDAELHVAAVLRDRLEESRAKEPNAADAPQVWGVGTAARLVKEMERGLDGEVRTAFDGVPIEEAAAARPDLIVLPRSSGRSFDFALTGPEWLAAGFRVLPPPPVHKGRLSEREIAERNIWNGLVVLVPEDADLGRAPAAATAADTAAPSGRSGPSAPASPKSPTEPQTGIRAAASSGAARYAGAVDGSGPPEFSARR